MVLSNQFVELTLVSHIQCKMVLYCQHCYVHCRKSYRYAASNNTNQLQISSCQVSCIKSIICSIDKPLKYMCQFIEWVQYLPSSKTFFHDQFLTLYTSISSGNSEIPLRNKTLPLFPLKKFQVKPKLGESVHLMAIRPFVWF